MTKREAQEHMRILKSSSMIKEKKAGQNREKAPSIFATVCLAFFIVIFSASLLRIGGRVVYPRSDVQAKNPVIDLLNPFEVKVASAYEEADYKAAKVAQSYGHINIAPNKAITFEARYKNTGKAPWYNSGANRVALNVVKPVGRYSPFQHDFWTAYYRPAKLLNAEVLPGEIGIFRFALQSPNKEGNYVENYQVAVRGITWMSGGTLEIPITVGTPQQVVKTVEPNNSASVIPAEAGIHEEQAEKRGEAAVASSALGPNIRIGVFNTVDPIRIQGDKNYTIKDENKILVQVSANIETQVSYNSKTGIYTVTVNHKTYTANSFIKFIADNANVIFAVPSYNNPVGWTTGLNDNLYRNSLEVRYASATGKLWVINELPLEWYLKGTAEMGLSDHREYQKAMSVAMRTYAYYRILNPKHVNENFTLDAKNDQVYRGYGMEKRSPKLVGIIDSTRGQMVHYNGQVVITPYFSRSDGRTRSWQEVWNGTKHPWLISKLDPHCYGMAKWGHGVGMSGCGARGFAKAGKKYDWILKYYYENTEIKEVY